MHKKFLFTNWVWATHQPSEGAYSTHGNFFLCNGQNEVDYENGVYDSTHALLKNLLSLTQNLQPLPEEVRTKSNKDVLNSFPFLARFVV